MKKLALGLLKSADEKLKSLSKGQGSRPTTQVSPTAAGPVIETPERLGRREIVNPDSQSKARHRSRSEGPRRGERQRMFEKNDSHGPQWAVSHEPRKSPRPLCLRQFSDDDIPEVNHSGSDTDSGDSGPKRWTRNPLLIKKTKKVEKTRATDWKKTVPVDENKSQTMPMSVGRGNLDSPSTIRQGQLTPNTWSNPDRISSASPKGKFQRLEEMRQQRMEVYPTSDEEGNPHSEISNQIRQRLSQVQAGRGKARKSSLGEYDGVNNKSGPEYTNYLKNAGDQIILEPKLKSEVPNPAPMTASFPSYRPMSAAFTGGSGSLSPTVTSKRDSMAPPSQSEKPAKPRMVVVEYPRKNQQNGGISNSFKLDPKYDTNPSVSNLRSEGRNQNRNSTAIAFGNNIQCIIPSQQQSLEQQFQPQPPLLPPRQQPVQQQESRRFLTQQQQQTMLQPHQEPSLPQPEPLFLHQSLQPQKPEPLTLQQQQPTFLQKPAVQQRHSFLQQHEQNVHQCQQPMQLGQQQHHQLPLPSQPPPFIQPDNVESTNSHIKPFGASSPLPPYRPVSFQPLHQAENGFDHCPPPTEFKTPEKQDPKVHRSKPLGSQKRHSRAEPISVSANNSDGGMLLHVPARHISKSYSDGDSLDELLESNMPYLEASSDINTLQLHRHSLKVIEKSFNGATTTTTITDTICVTSQPVTPSSQQPNVHRPTPIIPNIQAQQVTSTAPQMSASKVPTPESASKIQDIKLPSITGFSRLPTSTSNFSPEMKQTATYPPTKPFEASELGFIDYKPIITISESLLVSDSNKTKRSFDNERKTASDNCLSSSSISSNQIQNLPPQMGLSVPLIDAGMFSDVEYDIEVSERVKKWENYMKAPIKTSPTEAKPADMTGDNHLATTVKDMANEWSKYLSVIEEDSAAIKPSSTDTPKSLNKTAALNTPRNNSLETQRKINLPQKNTTQMGSISDSDMHKGNSPYTTSLGPTKGLLQVTPMQDTSSLALSRSYHEGAPNKPSSLDSPLFIPARILSNSSPSSDVIVPARSPVTNKECEFFSPQTRSMSSLHNTDSKMAASRPDQSTPDLFEITKMSENNFRRKSDTQAIRVNSQLSPRSMAVSDQSSWKNLIGDMQEKLKDTEIWSPQMDSHQGPVSIERVTARTLETIPFSEDPFWKEIEELTNFDQLTKDLPSDPKSPPPAPSTSRTKVYPPPESTTSCYQVSMVSSQPSNNYSLASLLSSLTEATTPSKSYSTSNLKTSFKSEGMNALDEVLLDLQPVLGSKPTANLQNRRYGSSTELSNTSSPRRPVSFSSGYTTNRIDAPNPQGLKTMFGSCTEVKDCPTFSNITQLQETTHSSMAYQSMTNLGEKQYDNVVNGNYQLDPSVLKEKLINTGLVERSPSGDDFALLLKNSKSTSGNILVAVRETEKPTVQPPVEENIEELKILARQVEDKLSEIKSKILKADDNNLDKMLATLKTFSPSASAMLSANVQTPTKVTSRDSFIARKAKLNDAISELEKIYDKLNLGSEVYLEHAKSTEFPTSLTGQENHGFRLSSSFSQLYESSQSHQTNSDTFHSDIRFLSSDHGATNRHYGELTQVPVKDVGSGYPVKLSTSSLVMGSRTEDASGDSVVSSNNEVPTRRSRTRRQRRAAMANESTQESRKARSNINKDENDAPRAYITSVTVERSPRSKSSVRADGLDGGSSRQANGSRRPKPPPRSSSLHRKPGREEERSRRKSTPPDFDLKQGNNDALSQSSNSYTEPTEQRRQMPKMMHHHHHHQQQQQRQELSCSSDSSAETIQQKKRAVSKSIAKMVDLFSSSDEERHKKSRVRPKPEQPPISEICEDDDSRSSKSSPKAQPSGKIMTPRSVKQRHDAKRQKAALAQQTAQDTCSAAVSDETPATEDSSAASKPPLPLRRQRSQSSEKCVSSSEDNAADEGTKSETHESSQSERNPKEKSSPTLSNASRNRWSISSARELVNTSDSSISSEHASSALGKVVIDRTERCRSFHELFASFEPDQKRIEKLRRLKKSASEEGAADEGTMRTFHSEPDLRDAKNKLRQTFGVSSFHLSITVND